ncbi:unnamed protein product [Prunus armeniaca]|uniref:Uncharacterized protein n=1 Tax=Prunus armeniaca TaxID=36596 RepID=A0A6J5UIT8_PRUAR|nr:hypothetical protein GBA52_012013 [Prunus armeniaca]CAB4275214.1 unnamed protein product [Prunus armeniaca]
MQDDDFEQGLVCPSFNSYSSDKLADVAAKVCREFDNLNLLEKSNNSAEQKEHDGHRNDDVDDDFEFVSFQSSGSQVFIDHNQIGPVFPVFNRDLLLDKSQRDLAAAPNNKEVAEEEEGDEDDAAALPSSSSSDVDELDSVPQGTYCVWMPKSAVAQDARGKCKIKSKSTGTSSSRRWSIKDLLRRSNSESGSKDSFVFLTPLSSSSKKTAEEEPKEIKKSSGSGSASGSGPGSGGGPNKPKGSKAVSMAHEAFYVRNKTVAKDGYNKRRSYLPYRQDLVGLFASVNAMSRTFPAL